MKTKTILVEDYVEVHTPEGKLCVDIDSLLDEFGTLLRCWARVDTALFTSSKEVICNVAVTPADLARVKAHWEDHYNGGEKAPWA